MALANTFHPSGLVRLSLFCALLVCLTFAASARCAEADDAVKVGFLAPLTGDMAAFGTDGRRAAEFALEDFQPQSKLKERKLQLVVEDSQCSGKTSAAAASRLTAIEHVQAIVHCGCSTEVLSAAPIIERAKTVLLASASESAAISQAGEYIFRISPNTRQAGSDLAEWIAGSGFRRAALITENLDYALSLRDEFVRNFTKLHGVIAADETYNPAENDFRILLSRIRATKPDVLFVNPQTGLKAGLIVKHLREINWTTPVFGNYAFNLQDAPRAAGGYEVLTGVRFVDYPVVSGKAGVTLLARFRKRYGEPQSDFNIAATYDAAMLTLEAIDQAGNNGVKIRDYFYALPQYAGMACVYRFDKNGDAEGIHYSRKEVGPGGVAVIRP